MIIAGLVVISLLLAGLVYSRWSLLRVVGYNRALRARALAQNVALEGARRRMRALERHVTALEASRGAHGPHVRAERAGDAGGRAAAYRRLVKRLHPDHGGSAAAMQDLEKLR